MVLYRPHYWNALDSRALAAATDACRGMPPLFAAGGHVRSWPHCTFEMPKRADDDIKWLIVYVLLSRVRSLANLRSIGMTFQIRKIIEAGPPSMLAENFERLFRTKITNTKAAAVAAKCALGWQ